MGLFDTFKKKPQAPPSPERENASEPMMLEPTLDKCEVIAILCERCGGKNAGEWLLFREHDLRITVEFGELQAAAGMFNVQLLLIAKHPFFDEDLVEITTGLGKTPDDAIRAAAENLAAGVLPFVIGASDAAGKKRIEVSLMGEIHRFRIPDAYGTSHAGAAEPTDLWELVRDTIPQYLGTKRCYWISLTSACLNGIPQCEARVNGIVCNHLTDILMQNAVKHKDTAGYCEDKAFILLVQDEETYKPCPFTKQEVGELVFRAFRLYPGIRDEETAQKVQATILSCAPQRNLGIEVVSFLPEVVAQQVVGFRDNDTLMPVIDRGKPDTELKKSQVRSFGYIEDAVFQYLRKQHPSENEIKQILAISAKFHALSEAIRNGIRIEDLKLSQLVYFVDRDYRVW